MTRRSDRRGGFTLIELLVTMAIIVTLAAVTIMFSSFAMDRDRAVKAANQLQGHMQISRSRAHRDGLPHGIRLIVNNPADPRVTTYQYIHSPAVIASNALSSSPATFAAASPYVQIEYPLDAIGQVPGTAAPNNVRQCRIHNLTPEQQLQVTVNSTLYLPDLGTYHRIDSVSGTNPMTVVLNDPSLQYGYPDAELGAATHYRTYNFGLYGPPEPLVGEEVMQMPENSCVDLNANRSFPNGNGRDYDILFAPSGQLVSVPLPSPNTGAYGHVFLWCRDPGRPDNFTQGGEHFLVVIKAQSGAVGTAPVDQQNAADFYSLGRKAVAGH